MVEQKLRDSTSVLHKMKGKYYRRQELEEEVAGWMRSSSSGFVMLGGNGSGKTTLLDMLWSQADCTILTPHEQCPSLFKPFKDQYVVVYVDAEGIVLGDEIRKHFEMNGLFAVLQDCGRRK